MAMKQEIVVRPGRPAPHDRDPRPTAAFSFPAAVIRLAAGGAAEAADALSSHLQRWEDQARAEAPHEQAAAETNADRARYALIGLLFVGQETTARALTALWRGYRIPSRSLRSQAAWMSQAPVLGHMIVPAKAQVDILVRRADDHVDRLARIGRLEEQTGRLVFRQGLDEIADKTMQAIARNPELAHLVHDQGATLAEEVIEEMEEARVPGARILESIVNRILFKKRTTVTLKSR